MRTKDVEKALLALSQREKDYQQALDEDAEAEHAYRLNKAQAFLLAEGSEKKREAESIVMSQALFLEHLKKKAAKEFTREKLRDVQQALSARQSLLKFEKDTDFASMQGGA